MFVACIMSKENIIYTRRHHHGELSVTFTFTIKGNMQPSCVMPGCIYGSITDQL